VFVRLTHCNLRCGWCDTAYTWNWEAHDPAKEILELDTDAILIAVVAAGHRNVVLTGGEPLLQQRQLLSLAERLKAGGRRIEVETNGTIEPRPTFAANIDRWNVSPKLRNSGNPARHRIVPAALAWFVAHPAATFKFVVEEPGDLQEIADLCGTTIETAIRVMSRWGKDGIVRTEREGFVLLDREALEALSLS